MLIFDLFILRCGLRYARSRAKKEGHNQTQRRRKDKGLAKRESATPPTSASPSYSSMRRSYGDGPFVSTPSAGSASGSDIYTHSGHPGLDRIGGTPSPSPPASSAHHHSTHHINSNSNSISAPNSNMNFVHYAPGGPNDRSGQPSYSSNNNSNFYSVPSPLSSNPPVLHSSQGGGHGNHHGHGHQLPPLGQITSYAGRLSPMLSSASPIGHSPLTSTLPPASFERERDRDSMRDLPPTPVSAEPRHPRRSILAQQ